MTELEVLHDSNHVLCVVKPACVPCVPDESGDTSLLDLAKAWVKREKGKPGDVFLGVVHRLDRPVSGVVCFARTSKGAARLSESFRSGVAKKTYVAAVEGVPEPRENDVRQWLVKDRERNVVRVAREGADGARLAHTRWTVLRDDGGRALVELSPITGRPHQLRVALASAGTPIAGDVKYGASAPLLDRSIALHARELVVPHPTRVEEVRCVAPVPTGAVWQV